MQKRNLLIGLVVVVVIAAGAYALFHKSSDTTTPASSTSSSSQKSSSKGDVVQTKTSSSVGQYLADANGNALYTYGPDTAGVSNCSGSCLYTWPIYAPDSTADAPNGTQASQASLPANVTIIKRSDGSSQYAYKDMPLYTFTSDSSGQVTGDGVSDFHIAKP